MLKSYAFCCLEISGHSSFSSYECDVKNDFEAPNSSKLSRKIHQPHLQNSSPIHSALSRKTPMLPSSISGFQRHLPHYSSAAVFKLETSRYFKLNKRTFLIRSTDPPQKPSHICHQTGFFRNFHHLHDSTFLGRGRHFFRIRSQKGFTGTN